MNRSKHPRRVTAGNDEQPSPEADVSPPQRLRRPLRVLILLVGIILPQTLLYGPSLSGSKILLPLDLLARPNCYLPDTPRYQKYLPFHNQILSDQILSLELSRRFCTQEVRAGRWPLWCPNYFLGAPLTKWPKYSPYSALYYAVPQPITLAWIHLVKSIIAGVGAYLFFKRALEVRFWPAVVGAWCYPLSGFFILWQGYTMSQTISWYPWLLLMAHLAVRKPTSWGGVGLAFFTGLLLISGQVDVAGLALISSGLYGVWWILARLIQDRNGAATGHSLLSLAGGWTLGIMLTAPYLMPMIEYSRTGQRVESRSRGAEERPPIGWSALPQVVLPEVHGRDETGNCYLAPGNRLESAAAGHMGLLACLVLAPLAWLRHKDLSRNIFWMILILVALSWTLDIPGLVFLWRLPGLNMFSPNRMAFAAAFAILSLSVGGLNNIWNTTCKPRWWFIFPFLIVLGLGIWSALRVGFPPEQLSTLKEQFMQAGKVDLVQDIQSHFRNQQLSAVIVCMLSAMVWLGIWIKKTGRWWFCSGLATLLLLELFWYARDVNPQCDHEIYFPEIKCLTELATREPGRVLGYNCLPARLSEVAGLRDLRGYDGVDPQRLMELLFSIPYHKSTPLYPYALTQQYIPDAHVSPSNNVQLHPVLDMLNVQYLIFRGPVLQGVRPFLSGEDYWVLKNSRAMPRAFVPRHVQTLADHGARLKRLIDPSFDARRNAFVEQPLDLPQDVRGTASIESEQPCEIVVRADMETAGLLVLSDLWDRGWKATVEGEVIPLFITNHVLRGMVLPAGPSRITLRYQPDSIRYGVGMMLGALVLLVIWGVTVQRKGASSSFSAA